MLGAMSAFIDPKILEQAMQVAISDEFELREGLGLLFGGFQEPKNREAAYAFIKTHFDEIANKMPAPYRAYLAFTFVGAVRRGSQGRGRRVLQAEDRFVRRWPARDDPGGRAARAVLGAEEGADARRDRVPQEAVNHTAPSGGTVIASDSSRPCERTGIASAAPRLP